MGWSYICGVTEKWNLLHSGVAPVHSSIPKWPLFWNPGCSKPGDCTVLHKRGFWLQVVSASLPIAGRLEATFRKSMGQIWRAEDLFWSDGYPRSRTENFPQNSPTLAIANSQWFLIWGLFSVFISPPIPFVLYVLVGQYPCCYQSNISTKKLLAAN